MPVVWLVRHGETDWNAAGRLQGWSDVSLNSVGRAQAIELRSELSGVPFDCVWSSDLTRAIETATLSSGIPVQDCRLREMHFGDLEGHTWSGLDLDLRATLVDFDRFAAPNGESAAGFTRRVVSFLDDLSSGRHLVFTHGGVIRAASRRTGAETFPGHGEVVKLEWEDCRR